ncbi:UDP-glycosyltransferase UGT5-like [Ochlerotatus camptorhynchus]|uniref:UDP-glycosyltransferase UGT5-like n=1 Tax=Ochlerotatus camptorhynchus TaxID=644619 RepID=UPI0031E36FFC
MAFKYSYFLCALVVLVVIPSACADNILFIQTLASKSHHIWNKQIFDRLYNNGHNLTIISFEEEQSVPGKTFLVVKDFMTRLIAEYGGNWDYTVVQSPFVNIHFMYDFYNKASRLLAEEEAVQRLLAYPRTFKFDLIIHDLTMGQFLLGFVEYFGNPPLVSISAFNIPPHVTTMADAPLRTTCLPHYASSFGTGMNFIERVKNTLYWALDIFYRNRIYMTNEDRRVKRLFGSNSTSVKLIEQRSDFILVNSDFSMDYYQALPPNVIPVGGLHVSRTEKVPPIVKQFIARAIKGVVLLSFGTNVASEMLGEKINVDMFKVFRSMPDYGFIWKHGDPASLGIMPTNVLVLKWVPQAAILSNTRTKLLISHGGLLSLQEATWHGIPVLSIPFFVDQYSNTDKLIRAGVGIKLLPKDINEESFKDAIMNVLDDPSYQARMKQRSYQFKAQPEHPLDRAVFWIEKVLENNGLSYLRSPALDMNIFQIYGIDMLTIILLIAFIYYLILQRHLKQPATTEKEKPKKE